MLDTRDRGNSLFPSLRQLAVTEWNNYYQVIVRLNWFRIYLVISPDKLVKYVAPDKSVGRGFWAVVVRVAATALVTLCCISQSELWWRYACAFSQLLTGCKKVRICCRLISDTLVEDVFYTCFHQATIDLKTYKNAETFTAIAIQIKIQLLL